MNIGWGAIYWRDLATAEVWTERAHQLSLDREIASFDAYVTGELALIDEMRGNWAEAEAKVCFVLDTLAELGTANIVASTLLGRLQARRGEPDAKTHLMDGWERSLQANEVQRTTPAAISLAEYVWIGGKLDEAIFPQMREILADCIDRDSPWMAGELAFWLRLIGEIEDIPDIAPEPYRLAGEGDWEGAAAFWKERGIPYDRAVALSHGDIDARIEALAILDDLGAIPVAARLRSELAEAGVHRVPRGPTRSTRDNPFGLTARQLEVLRHLSDGMTNAEIADRLFVSNRTVDHHVSAILGKLGANSRSDAASMAREAGLLDR